MPNVATQTIVVLWEHELRIAAKSIAEVRRVIESQIDNQSEPDEEKRKERAAKLNEAVWNAIDCCGAALVGVETDGNAITISSIPKPTTKRATP